MSFVITARKPRNPLVAAAHRRHAGAHRRGTGALRQQARQAHQRQVQRELQHPPQT